MRIDEKTTIGRAGAPGPEVKLDTITSSSDNGNDNSHPETIFYHGPDPSSWRACRSNSLALSSRHCISSALLLAKATLVPGLNIAGFLHVLSRAPPFRAASR